MSFNSKYKGQEVEDLLDRVAKGEVGGSVFNWSILKHPVPTVGDIVYMADGSLKFKSPSQWDNSLGTPVGIIMIEEGYAPDGKIRILSLDVLDGYNWGPSKENWDSPIIDSPLPNYQGLAAYYNNGEYYETNDLDKPIPSDIFTGEQAYGDPLAFFEDGIDLTYGAVPSPYFNGKLHPAYTEVTEGGNALSDFNGLSNTQTLVNAGSEYEAANACWNYKDTANSNLQWYLPAMGELCFLMARLGTIDKSLKIIGMDAIFQPESPVLYFASTEFIFYSNWMNEEGVWSLEPSMGMVGQSYKDYFEGCLTRPIAMIDSF